MDVKDCHEESMKFQVQKIKKITLSIPIIANIRILDSCEMFVLQAIQRMLERL